MKNSIVKTLKNCPKFTSALMTCYWVLSNKFQKKSNIDYRTIDTELIEGMSVDDIATGLFLRAILMGKHEVAVEIGTFDGKRIMALKKLADGLQAYGVDILSTYKQPFRRNDVAFRYHDTAFFDALAPGALILSRSTLTCFAPEELREFFSQLKKIRASVAYFEPNPYFTVDKHIVRLRKGVTSYYHPYDDLLEELGYCLHASKRYTQNWSGVVCDFECIKFQYATI